MNTLKSLRTCHDRLRCVIGKGGESYQAVELVERYRQYFKPRKVRVLLLAESHVFTSETDRTMTIRPIAKLPGYPSAFARFVYCLGYGERQLVDGATLARNSGTPQFWKIFYSCLHPIAANADFAPILASKTDDHRRLQNKIDLLIRLKKSGIWLGDASIAGLYIPGGTKPELKTRELVMRMSWDGYVGESVAACKPQYVIIIGKWVDTMIGDKVRALVGAKRCSVLPQPGARLSTDEIMQTFRTYYRICNA